MVSVFVGTLLIVLMVLTCLSIVVDGTLAIPWTVCSVQSGISFAQFFEKLKAGSIDLFQSYAGKLQQSELSQASIAKSKETPFSAVDKQLPVDEVCCQFGAYVKLSCCKQPAAQPSTHLQVTVTQCVTTVLPARTPSRSEFLLCEVCFLYVLSTSYAP